MQRAVFSGSSSTKNSKEGVKGQCSNQKEKKCLFGKGLLCQLVMYVVSILSVNAHGSYKI